MNIKRIWLIIPTFLLPYFTLALLALIFLAPGNAFLGLIMEKVFGNFILNMIPAFLLFLLAAAGLSVVCFVMSIRKKWDALSLAKTAMLIKLLLIPAYILIFVLGAIFALTIFTFAFSYILLSVGFIVLILTGLITVSAVICASREGYIEFKRSIWVIILQFFYVTDVVSSIIFYVNLKRSLSGSDKILTNDITQNRS